MMGTCCGNGGLQPSNQGLSPAADVAGGHSAGACAARCSGSSALAQGSMWRRLHGGHSPGFGHILSEARAAPSCVPSWHQLCLPHMCSRSWQVSLTSVDPRGLRSWQGDMVALSGCPASPQLAQTPGSTLEGWQQGLLMVTGSQTQASGLLRGEL